MNFLKSLIFNISLDKLFKLIMGIIVLLILSILLSLGLLYNIYREEREVVNNEITYRKLSRDLINTNNYLANQARRFVNEGDIRYYDNYIKELNEQRSREEIKDNFSDLSPPREELALIESSVKKGIIASHIEQEAIELVKEGLIEERYFEQNINRAQELIYGGYYDQHQNQALESIEEFLLQMEERVEAETNTIRERANFFLTLIFIILAVMLVAFLMIFTILNKKIIIPVKSAVSFSDAIAEGNFNTEKLKIKGDDELAKLNRHLNQMRDNIKEMILQIIGSINELSAYEKEIAVIDDKIDYVFNLITDVKRENKEVNRNIAQITNGINQTAEKSDNLALKAEEVSKVSAQIYTLVKESNDKINFADQLIKQAVVVMNNLDQSVAKIDNISDRILNIADQTNLLSLVGIVKSVETETEDGGVANVADDIKKLADESMEATNEVKEVAKEIKLATKEAVDIMNGKNKDSETITDTFKEIQNSASNVFKEIQRIDQAIKIQLSDTQKINNTIAEISSNCNLVNKKSTHLYQNNQKLEEIIKEVAKTKENLASGFKRQAQESKQKLELIKIDL